MNFASLQGYIMTFFVPLQGITTIIPSHKSSLQPTSNPNIPPLSLILFIFEKNTQQVMKRIIYIIFCTFLISCGQYNAELENALKLAGENRRKIEKNAYMNEKTVVNNAAMKSGCSIKDCILETHNPFQMIWMLT